MILLDILIIIILVITVLLLVVLFIPFSYAIRLKKNDDYIYYGARVNWLFGLVQVAYNNHYLFYIRLFGIVIKINHKDKDKKKEKKEKKKEKKQKKKNKNKKGKVTITAIKYLIKCIGKIISKYKPKKMVIKGQLGFADPSITGFAQGFSSCFNTLINTKKLEFIYEKEVYNGTIYTNGKVTIYYIVYIFLRLIIYKPTRLLLKSR